MKNYKQYVIATQICESFDGVQNIDSGSDYNRMLESLINLYQEDSELVVETLIALQDEGPYLADSFKKYNLPVFESLIEPNDRHRNPRTLADKFDRIKNLVLFGRKITNEIEHIKDNLHKATPEERARGGVDADLPHLTYNERKKAFDEHLKKLQGKTSPWARNQP